MLVWMIRGTALSFGTKCEQYAKLGRRDCHCLCHLHEAHGEFALDSCHCMACCHCLLNMLRKVLT